MIIIWKIRDIIMSDVCWVGIFFLGFFFYVILVGIVLLFVNYYLLCEIVKLLGGCESVVVIGIEVLLIVLGVFVLLLFWSMLLFRLLKKKGCCFIVLWFYSGVFVVWLVGLLYGVFFFVLNFCIY